MRLSPVAALLRFSLPMSPFKPRYCCAGYRAGNSSFGSNQNCLMLPFQPSVRTAAVGRQQPSTHPRESSFTPSGRSSLLRETCLYSVCRVMPNSSQRSPIFVSGWPMAALAKRSLAVVILNGRAPLRPRARADASPAIVRSEISSRSNSANAVKMPNTSLPAAVLVSTAAP